MYKLRHLLEVVQVAGLGLALWRSALLARTFRAKERGQHIEAVKRFHVSGEAKWKPVVKPDHKLG